MKAFIKEDEKGGGLLKRLMRAKAEREKLGSSYDAEVSFDRHNSFSSQLDGELEIVDARES